MTFKKKLNGLLLSHQMKRKTFAKLCGVDQTRANMWLEGMETPSKSDIRRIAQVFQYDAGVLLELIEKSKAKPTPNTHSELVAKVRSLSKEQAERALAAINEILELEV